MLNFFYFTVDPTYRHLIMQRRKKSNRKGFLPAIMAGLAGVNLISQLGKSFMNRKSGVRKGLSLEMAKRGMKPKRGLVGSTGKRKTGFDRNKGLRAKRIIKAHLLGSKRKGRYNRRKGELDSNFLSEFGGDVFNPEPTVSKTWGRTAYEALKGIWGSREARKMRDSLAKQGEKALIDKINSLSEAKAKNIASKIVEGKPIPMSSLQTLTGKKFLKIYRD